MSTPDTGSWIMKPPPGYPHAVGVIRITEGKESTDYFVRELHEVSHDPSLRASGVVASASTTVGNLGAG